MKQKPKFIPTSFEYKLKHRSEYELKESLKRIEQVSEIGIEKIRTVFERYYDKKVRIERVREEVFNEYFNLGRNYEQELTKAYEEGFNEGYVNALEWCKTIGIKDPIIQGKIDLLKKDKHEK